MLPNRTLPGPTFEVILKLSEACNLACDYCYYYFHEYDANKKPPSMSDEVIDELPQFLARSVDDLELSQLGIGLHGGEPLIMKKAKFARLCRSLRETLDGKTRLHLALQTNGTLLDEEWIDIFAEHDVHVGVSIDGPKFLHDRRRLDHRGRGSYEASVRGLRLLQSAVDKGILKGAGALAVVHGDDGDVVLDHLVRELRVFVPNLNFPRGGWDNPEAVNWNKSVDAHRRMIRYAFDNFVTPEFRRIRQLTTVLLNMAGERGAAANDRMASMRPLVATISSDGVVYPDDNLLGVDPSVSESTLSIFGRSLRDYIASPTFSKLIDAADSVPDQCGKCEWFRSCRSGYLYDRFGKESGYARPSVFCDTIQMIHEEALAYLVDRCGVRVESIAETLSQRPGASAKDMMALLLGEESVADATAPLAGDAQ